MNDEEWQKRLTWLVIGAVVTVIIPFILTPVLNSISTDVNQYWSSLGRSSTPTAIVKPQPTVIPRLKSLYSGTYVGISDDVKGNYGNVMFTVKSQDGKGNVVATLKYNDNSTPNLCVGTITGDEHIELKCNDGSSKFDFSGLIYTDGHIEATETYTDVGTTYKNILR